MKILAVDTSTCTGSVAILDGDTLVAELQVTSGETHAKRLMSAVDTALRMAGMSLDECDGFAVTRGPGSFTGLRIGISAIKGLAFALRKPVAGVSTLDALVHQFPWFPHFICPMLDARKGEIYTALYESGADGSWEKLVSDCVVEPQAWLAQIQDVCLFVGDGVGSYRTLIEQCLGSRARFVPSHLNVLRASVVAILGRQRIQSGQAGDAALLVPQYVRRSDAEIKLERQRAG